MGHIEDIAVAKDQRGKKLGLRIIHTLDAIAEAVGCYKVGALVWYGPTCIANMVRPSWIAPRPTRGFTSNAGTSAWAWRWRTTMQRRTRGCCRQDDESCLKLPLLLLMRCEEQ